MSSASSDSGPPSRSLRSVGDGTTPRRTPQDIVREKLTKAWPVLAVPEKKADLDQIVLDHISGPIIYESFAHIVDPNTLSSFDEKSKLTTYLNECHGYMPVKLMISALAGIEDGGITTMVRKGYTSMLGITYGLSHVDLLIGDMLVGWFDNELVGIRKLAGDASLRRTVAVFDLHAGIKAAGATEWLNALSNHIAAWNAGYHYSRNYTKAVDVHGAKLANCQGFANWIIREMKLENMKVHLSNGDEITQPVISLAMNDFIANFVANPSSWEAHLKLGTDTIPTSSHEDFDNWVAKRYQGAELKIDGQEFDLLKGIDRGFWMRYHANTQFVTNQRSQPDPTDATELKRKNEKIVIANAAAERYKPRSHDLGRCVCPFGNPLAYESRIVELIPYNAATYTPPAEPTASRCIIS